MGMTVLVSDPYAQVDDRRFLKLPMEELLGRADYVICLAIANEETENLLDAAAFARMKPDAFFINMSRGNLVDEAALLKALTEDRIAGAAMDVGRAPDQMPSPELARLPNVIATPHIGGLTPPASESQAFDTVRQVEALVKGEVPPGAANLKDWTRRESDHDATPQSRSLRRPRHGRGRRRLQRHRARLVRARRRRARRAGTVRQPRRVRAQHPRPRMRRRVDCRIEPFPR